MRSLISIGYFPMKVVLRPEWLRAAGVRAIYSVSNCVSSGPTDWILRWAHNEMWVYSTIPAAWAFVPDYHLADYVMLAYRMLPTMWDKGVERPFAIPPLNVDPLPPDFHRVGFDVVSIEKGTAGFGCSPLSCNHMAEEISTNENCLLDDIELAIQTASAFSCGNVEPGPYFVVEVLRQDK